MSQISSDIKNKLMTRAEAKSDGIYSYNGILYRVEHNSLTHYAFGGQIFYCSGYFEMLVGVYEYPVEARKKLLAVND